MAASLSTKIVCGECGGSSLLSDYESGELICQSCGYVINSTLISLGPEWKAFDQDQKANLPRVGAPMNWSIHDKGLSTTIGWQDVDASGRRLGLEERVRLLRLRKWHRRSKVSDSTQRSLVHALSEMSKIAYRLTLPRSVIETSSMIYRRAIKNQLIKGRTVKCIAVASILIACRQCGVIRTIDEVASAATISKKEAARNYRYLLRGLKADVPKSNLQGYISKISNRLRLRGDTENLANSILIEAAKLRLTSGRGPSGIAAACIYISGQIMNEHLTQAQVAKGAQVTEVTIRNRYKELARILSFTINI